jgi:hypothetical protein
LTTQEHGEHHVAVPRHSPLRVGTLSAILRDIEHYFSITREELISRLMGRGRE